MFCKNVRVVKYQITFDFVKNDNLQELVSQNVNETGL